MTGSVYAAVDLALYIVLTIHQPLIILFISRHDRPPDPETTINEIQRHVCKCWDPKHLQTIILIEIIDLAQTYDSAPMRRPDIKKKLVVVGDGGKFESSSEL